MSKPLEQRLAVFRALTGARKAVEGVDLFAGVSGEALAKDGICSSNFSDCQYSRFLFREERRVPGLPVFLNFAEAVSWVKNKKYENSPAIASARLPLRYLFGKRRSIRLARNFMDSSGDYEPSRQDIKMHLSGERLVSGEAYINSVCRRDLMYMVRGHQVFYRPAEMKDGRIVLEAGFTQMPALH